MNVLVPLAGPDFERPDGSVKAEARVDGVPLLRAALEQRSWWPLVDPADLVFVLREGAPSRRFAEETLRADYPGARQAWVSCFTGGAALSAAAGAALATKPAAPVIVDLCDILFESEPDLLRRFASDPRLGGVAATFPSTHPQYSYLEMDEAGRMRRAREKQVISATASAGVYAFRDLSVFFAALAHSLRHHEVLSHRGALFVCPMLNGVVEQGLEVRCMEARNVVDVKIPAAV